MMKKIKKLHRYYWCLLVIFIALLSIGIENVFSATFAADRLSGSSYSHFYKQVGFTVLGFFVAAIFYFKDYHVWRKYITWETVGTIALLIVVLCVGTVVNGSRRWISLGFFSFQPSEIAKLVSILYASHWISKSLEQHKEIEFLRCLNAKKTAFWQRIHVVPHAALWAPLIMAFLVIIQPDAGTAIVIFAIPVIMLLVSGAHILKIKIPLLVLLIGGIAVLCYEPYRLSRILIWWNPWQDAQNAGYQTIQGLIAIGTGHITGQGIGTGVSKFGSLPEAHTDFAFAVFAQEWGLCGTLLIIFLFFALMRVGFLTAMYCKDTFGSMLALGLTLYLGGQGFINIAMVSNILPVVGVPLPFISYGGTSLLVNMTAVAILLNISRQNYRNAEKERMQHPMPPLQSLKEESMRSQFPQNPENK